MKMFFYHQVKKEVCEMDIIAMERRGFARLALLLSFTVIAAGLLFASGARAENRVEGFKVEPGIVCMVTDKVMGKPQIPVVVEGKTYYGCCKNCVGTLKNDVTVRYAKDPVTGAMVDKSKAFILEGPAGDALYFESAMTAEKFVDSMTR